MSVRVRFAPSPTGWLHLGGVRTALINYLFAKKQNGTIVVRIEDTDIARGNNTFLLQQLQNLQWLGLQWDEGPHSVTLEGQGPYAPYQQSKRLNIYKKYAQKLLDQGKAYYCFLTEAEITEIKQKVIYNKQTFRVDSPYRNGDLKQAQQRIQNGDSAVIRFKIPEVKKDYILQDIVRKKVVFPSDMVGDFILLRSSGLPVYNFACVIDDYLMKISHCFRSEEHLANTLRQLMIYEAFSWTPPSFGHLSIILGEDRKKLSKRHGAVNCSQYKQQMYLPEAILNFLALMGWNPKTKQEIFSISELIDCFSLEGLNSSPGIFDIKKLDWINAQHLKNKTDQEIWNQLQDSCIKQNFIFPESNVWKVSAIKALRDSFSSLDQALHLLAFLAENYFTIQKSATDILLWPSTKNVLTEWKQFLTLHSEEYISADMFLAFCKDIQKKISVKGKQLFMPMRVSILGQAQGLELKKIIALIKREILLKRVTQTLQEINKGQ